MMKAYFLQEKESKKHQENQKLHKKFPVGNGKQWSKTSEKLPPEKAATTLAETVHVYFF